MHCHALICDAEQHFTLEEVELSALGATSVGIRTLYSGISVGTEFALIRNKVSWGPYPLCTGYMGVGVVERIGAAVTEFAIGEQVFFRGNSPLRRANGENISCVSGTHASQMVIDVQNTHGLDHLPAGVSLPAASMFVMPAVGLYGVDLSNPRMGETVVVYGVGLIGLGVVAACVHRGCVVIAVDVDDQRLDAARRFGANYAFNSTRDDIPAEVRKLAPAGADVVFEASGVPALIDPAIALCRKFGKFVWQGNYGEHPIAMHFMPAHGRQLTMFFPCDDGLFHCRRAVLRNMSLGALPWQSVITHVVAASDAPAFFDQINRNAIPGMLGATIHWSD